MKVPEMTVLGITQLVNRVTVKNLQQSFLGQMATLVAIANTKTTEPQMP